MAYSADIMPPAPKPLFFQSSAGSSGTGLATAAVKLQMGSSTFQTPSSIMTGRNWTLRSNYDKPRTMPTSKTDSPHFLDSPTLLIVFAKYFPYLCLVSEHM